jgi:hypothetical protein
LISNKNLTLGEVDFMSRNHRNHLVPEAGSALERLKLETAAEVGLQNYENIDKGELTSRENGKVGGNMVKKMIEVYEQEHSQQ